jgi:hypothetical protein
MDKVIGMEVIITPDSSGDKTSGNMVNRTQETKQETPQPTDEKSLVQPPRENGDTLQKPNEGPLPSRSDETPSRPDETPSGPEETSPEKEVKQEGSSFIESTLSIYPVPQPTPSTPSTPPNPHVLITRGDIDLYKHVLVQQYDKKESEKESEEEKKIRKNRLKEKFDRLPDMHIVALALYLMIRVLSFYPWDTQN